MLKEVVDYLVSVGRLDKNGRKPEIVPLAGDAPGVHRYFDPQGQLQTVYAIRPPTQPTFLNLGSLAAWAHSRVQAQKDLFADSGGVFSLHMGGVEFTGPDPVSGNILKLRGVMPLVPTYGYAKLKAAEASGMYLGPAEVRDLLLIHGREWKPASEIEDLLKRCETIELTANATQAESASRRSESVRASVVAELSDKYNPPDEIQFLNLRVFDHPDAEDIRILVQVYWAGSVANKKWKIQPLPGELKRAVVLTLQNLGMKLRDLAEAWGSGAGKQWIPAVMLAAPRESEATLSPPYGDIWAPMLDEAAVEEEPEEE